MLSQAQEHIPRGPDWLYEPKWDGFRAIVFRSSECVQLCSRNGQPLERYFPEVVRGLEQALAAEAIIDGEIILPGVSGLDFDALSQRIHPAKSRIEKLSKETPAGFVAFDCLADGTDDLRALSNAERRARLLNLFRAHDSFFVTPQTTDATVAETWFRDFEGAGCDGVIARRGSLAYLPGERAMVKVKHGRTADVVVGGFREGKTPGTVGSLLLGLYDEHGVLHHVGHTSSFDSKTKRALREELRSLEGGVSFGAGRTPDAPSRWSKSGERTPWVPVHPRRVCEIRYDYVQGPRFRHAATFLRWRTDKPPEQCFFSQLTPPHPFSLARIVALSPD